MIAKTKDSGCGGLAAQPAGEPCHAVEVPGAQRLLQRTEGIVERCQHGAGRICVGPQVVRVGADPRGLDGGGAQRGGLRGIAVGVTSDMEKPRFRADHPFLFLIRERSTGSILFLGRVVDMSGQE